MKIKISNILISPPKESFQWKFSVRPGGWIIAEGKDKRIRFGLEKENTKFWLFVNGKAFHGEFIKDVLSAKENKISVPDQELTAQFPGKVKKILVKPGQKVKAGDLLLLLEAMKMEFSIKSPKDSKVKDILVSEGSLIQPGTQLVELEGD